MTTTALIGTAKGLFVLTGERGGRFAERGPLFPGENVDATLIDARRDARHPTWFVGSMSFRWGPTLRRSDDAGATWTEKDEAPVAFPEGAGASVARIWQLVPGPIDEPDVVYAGVEPAALFRSSDGGRSFQLVEGLWNHPHRAQWAPGGGGLCLHTILIDPRDPDALTVAISTGGVYRSDDGGVTWRPSNRGIRAVFLPDPDVEFG
ncbi:MAG: exo-alpha-sialidase, partial [Actinobacteria bacterium]